MNQIVEQVEIGVAKILKIAQKSNSNVYVGGHSAGAHLASMMLYVDFENKYNVTADLLAGLILVSGVFDLQPIVETEINDNIKMDLNVAKKNSPLLFHDFKLLNKNVDVLISYGESESPAFIDQSECYGKVS
jgi:arylformamidase